MGNKVGKSESPKKVSIPETKLEAKTVEAMKRKAAAGTSMKSFNSIILKFPKIDESLRNCKVIFKQFEEEINDLFQACDINEDKGIDFNEFIVLLCLVYLLKDDAATLRAKERVGMPDLEATFETLVDAFVFLDKNKDGYVSKSEMVQAINETTSGEGSGQIAMKRFEEMDWDKNGMVNFKEFLFAFTGWVGIDDNEDEEEGGEKV
ncbi:putative calcium-binding protein cml21 [Quercus suber]|uniref:Calcium-binding protein cml21 n=1 Tax=Quercus suber TaxID=58331 RepID=A0AAW0JEX9_QUESU